jgi:tRNA (guanine-N7-)-methyltransferase
VRQHVNPLSQKYRTAIKTPAWEEIYARAEAPLHLDIGCARGKFLLAIAAQNPHWNFLGVEIREALVIEANEQKDQLGLNNLHFLFGNINVEPLSLLSSLASPLQRVTIQFPDPWFKTRHSKRRVVQQELVAAIAQVLRPGGLVVIQSDLEALAGGMVAQFQAHPHFHCPWPNQWLAHNPLGVATEREKACQRLGRPVYRQILQRQSPDQLAPERK